MAKAISPCFFAESGMLTIWGPAAININLEPKSMVSYISGSAPRQPGRVVLMGTGPLGFDPGAFL